MILSKISNFLIASLLLLSFVSCKKESISQILYAQVNVTLSVITELSKLGIGSTIYCPTKGSTGIKGIILYRSDETDFVAFERLCTYYPADTAAIVIENSTGTIATCPKCGSKFELITGSIMQGHAKFSLKQYQTYLQGNFLYITN